MDPKFLSEQMKQDFYALLHPDVVDAVLKVICNIKFGPTITDCVRTDDESQRIYMKIADRLLKTSKLKLSKMDLVQLTQIENLSPIEVMHWARFKPTWHKAFCAVDIRLSDWTEEQKVELAAVLHDRFPKPMWEAIIEPHGTGPHLHLAKRDFGWLKNCPGGLKSNQGRKK